MNDYKEKYRPQYHVTHPSGWLNDPNGMVFSGGVWHLFYQLEPRTKYAGHDKYWGHAISRDLANWEIRPIALEPDEHGSIWSGSAIVDSVNSSGLFPDAPDAPDKQGLVAFYTSVPDKQRQSMAYSKDGGETWIKYNNGAPIISDRDDPLDCPDFRDPKVFWHNESDQWMMIVAGGPIRFYSSKNLIDWKPEGMQNDIHTECPDFFELEVSGTNGTESKWILFGGGVWYMVGGFAKVNGVWSFVPDTNERYPFNYGIDVYAAQTFSNAPDGRCIKVDWMTFIGYAGDRGIQDITDPWCHALTLPYELGLIKYKDTFLLTQNPVKELAVLRGEAYSRENIRVEAGTKNVLEDLSLAIYEIDALIDASCGDDFGFRLRTNANADEFTEIRYDAGKQTLTLDRAKSGEIPTERFQSEFTADIEPENGKIRLRIFVDNSSVEIFAQNGKVVFTGLIFPDPASTGLEFFTRSAAKIDSLNIYKLNPSIKF
ncbi:MAG: GH32 C-terminal domain-containing protein [Oscillospiraceae bacterium]|nr:GH32 C-terminal domain-containing protein [Oscillospiraceae bacterium]